MDNFTIDESSDDDSIQSGGYVASFIGSPSSDGPIVQLPNMTSSLESAPTNSHASSADSARAKWPLNPGEVDDDDDALRPRIDDVTRIRVPDARYRTKSAEECFRDAADSQVSARREYAAIRTMPHSTGNDRGVFSLKSRLGQLWEMKIENYRR